MTIGPDRRLVVAATSWTAASLLVVLWPPVWPALAGALAGLIGLAAADLWALRRARAVTVSRTLPQRAFVGRPSEILLEVRNPRPEPARVDVLDEVPVDVAPEEPSFPELHVPAGEVLVLRYTVRPVRRGARPLGPTLALERSRLGLWRRRVVTPAQDALRVFPDVTRFLRPEALDPRRVLAAIGVRPARRRGEGMEFESLREYVVGDDPRRLDWAASARRGRLVARVYQHERNHTVMIALDTSRLMGARIAERSKLDHAVDATLALVYAALAAGDRVGLAIFDRELRGYLAPRTHRRHIGLFGDVLHAVEPRPAEADYRALVRALTARQRQQALVVILTDFVEADPAVLVGPLVVLARRHRVLLVAVRDRTYGLLEVPTPPADEDPLDLYRRVVLDELVRQREATLGRLRQHGLQTLDLVPEAITAAVLNRYLALRQVWVS